MCDLNYWNKIDSIPLSIQSHLSPVVAVGDPRFDPILHTEGHYGIFETEEEAVRFAAAMPDDGHVGLLDTRSPRGLLSSFKLTAENNMPEVDFPSLEPGCSVTISCEQTRGG